MKLRLLRGEYDSLCCPLTVVEHHWADDDGDKVERTTRTCNAALHVIYTASIDLSAVEAHTFDPPHEAGWANASRWTIECEHGHVLATSTRDGTGGTDHGDPVDVAALFDLPGPDPEDEEPGTVDIFAATYEPENPDD